MVNSVVNNPKLIMDLPWKEYIDYVKKVGFEAIRELFSKYYKEIVSTTKATEKQAICIASVMIGNKLSQECLFEDEEELSIKDIASFINDKEEIETWRSAYEYVLGLIASNSKRFEDGNFGEIWGKCDEFTCTINKDILVREELKKNNYEFESIKRQWADKKLIEKNSQGRFYTMTKVYNRKANYVIINIKDV